MNYLTSFLLILGLPFFAYSQITTGSIEGIITDFEDKEPLIGATIVATHTPTGTQYFQTVQIDGSYILSNLRSGGPYTLEVSYVGFEKLEQKDIYVSIGQATKVSLQLKTKSVVDAPIVVTVDKDDPFSGTKDGVGTNIGKKQLKHTPTLNRSLQDITRLSPNGFQSSFGGNNYRFNNLSIDGVSNNDVIGFQDPASGAGGSVASGTPGALAGSQPISLDAIEEVQLSLSPFDVRMGNFTGANINTVTRGGTNQFSGSVYLFGRNQWLTGLSVDDGKTPINSYYDVNMGGRLGGAIIKNKLFFFANYEFASRNEPILNVPGTPSSNVPREVVDQITQHLVTNYGYDPGSSEATNIEQTSHKIFARFDWNIAKNHQLTLRDNLVFAYADRLERGSSIFKYGSQAYRHHSRNNSLVAELKSSFDHNMSNHLILGWNNMKDNRTFDGNIFPHIEIGYNTSNTIFIGPYREASIYGVNVNSFQFTDNFTIHRKKHKITIGTNNDFYDIHYCFLTAWNGRWEYKTVDNFLNNTPSRIRGVYNYTNNDYNFNRYQPSAKFGLALLSVYVQDRFRVNERFSITGGIRLDLQVNLNPAPVNAEVAATPEFANYGNQYGGIPQFNPRLAFNWIMDNNERFQLRGGTGIYSGRIPFAWYAYSYYISGNSYGNIDLKPNGAMVPLTDNLIDLRNQQPNLTEINLVENNFKLPSVWRSSLAFDIKLPHRIFVTVEGMFSKSLTAIVFKSLNLKDSTAQYAGADNRSYYLGSSSDRKINPNFTNVFGLGNTDKGYQYSISLTATKKIGNFFNAFVAYTFGESKDLVNGVRNSMAANFSWNQAVNSNELALTYSNFDIRHRFVFNVSYLHKWSKSHETSLNLVATVRSGSPFSFVYAGDLNKDGSSKNDVVYIPRNASEIRFDDIKDDMGNVVTTAAQQWEQLDNYINNNAYLNQNRGNYANRNGARTPWNGQIDLRLSHTIYFKREKNNQRLEISLDIINFANLLNHKWGWQAFVPNLRNASYNLLDFKRIDSDQTPVFQFNNPQGDPWQIDQLNSRWQMQLGLRWSF
ncbi:TonB-dependent receptor [Aureispira anguillae]|uniref:Carboxypeptidase regulatory-like domain-containing protein n=1 Tax=Aureispira anguillae TaxID=2864201 RepID=A0A915VKI8_9BACT|nr:carboxypeptidase regulatory-like domain-containing protein [Aureispira anguillae]BDS09723.1 carboxypeptidase regulatory-like domain-containing protein [Aureispira anguillae]